MILILNICREGMHYHEFVRPIEDVLRSAEESFITKQYLDVSKRDIDMCHRIIIAGTSLKDMSYIKNISRFRFLKTFEKPVLGICGGMQVLCIMNGCKLVGGSEIGLNRLDFNAEFLGAKGSREVYMLHNMTVKTDANLHDKFNIYSKSVDKEGASMGYVQAVKHKKLKHYGTLFHPEVRNKDMILNFLNA